MTSRKGLVFPRTTAQGPWTWTQMTSREGLTPSRDEALALCRLPPQAGHHPMCRPPNCSCPMGPGPELSTPLYLTQESEAPSRDEALASCRLPPQAGHYPMCRPPTCSCTEQTAVPTMGTDPHGTSAAKSAASPRTSPLVRRRSSSSSSSRSTPAASRLKKTKTLEDSSTLEDSRTPEDNQLLAFQDSSTLEVELPVIGAFSKASASRCQQVFSSHCH